VPRKCCASATDEKSFVFKELALSEKIQARIFNHHPSRCFNMRLKTAIAAATLLSLPIGSAMADTFWRNVMTSGATTASSYLTSRDHKLVVAAQDDASSFVASEGAIRGPFLEAAMREARAENPGMQASDMELANAILAKNAVAE
jgi:uncharacterized protein (TIGR02448 family)